MKTVAIDTNALLAFRLKREPQYQQVKQLFERCLEGLERIFIPDAVFLECEWVLRSFYKQSKEQVVIFFQELLLVEGVVLKDKENLQLVINLHLDSSSVSFTDCIILKQIQSFETDEFLTFDDNLKKLYLKTK